jgi:hypothetical protein
MNPANGVLSYSNVTFHLVCENDPNANDQMLDGRVILRAGEMILEVEDYDPHPPITVVGHPHTQPPNPFLPGQSYWFEGTSPRHGTHVYWADAGRAWVGLWHDSQGEWHFSFVLNPTDAKYIPDVK